MRSNILDSEIIKLTTSQQKMVRSGWGNDAVDSVVVEKITYLSENLRVKGFIAKPISNGGKFPCIIWNRGGYGNAGALDEFNAHGILGQIASWGYTVFASQYRGNAGGEGVDEFGGDDVNDVLNLIPLADEVPNADCNLWGIEGWSRGGMMTYLALIKEDRFKVAVISGGIADLRCTTNESKFMSKIVQHIFNKNDQIDFEQKCKSRSILSMSERLPKTTPLLIIHGAADTRVMPHDSLDLSAKLIQHNIPFRLLVLENGDHFLKSHRKEVSEARRAWFNKYLQS